MLGVRTTECNRNSRSDVRSESIFITCVLIRHIFILWEQIKSLVDGVMQSTSNARQSEIKGWEEEITPCEHTLTVEQFEPGTIPPSGEYR